MMYSLQKKLSIHNTASDLGDIEFQMDYHAGLISLIFTPDDADNNDYDLKIFQNTFQYRFSRYRYTNYWICKS